MLVPSLDVLWSIMNEDYNLKELQTVGSPPQFEVLPLQLSVDVWKLGGKWEERVH